MYPWFVQALQDKTLLLASNGEWDQALDTAQRLLDVDHDNLDALQVLFFYFYIAEKNFIFFYFFK
jgi:hypothetical protein